LEANTKQGLGQWFDNPRYSRPLRPNRLTHRSTSAPKVLRSINAWRSAGRNMTRRPILSRKR